MHPSKTMRKMFRKKQTKPTGPVVYPGGSCVRTDSGVFYIRAGKRFRIQSEEILNSWNFHRVIESSETALSKYRIAGKIGFRDGSLIHNIADARIYLVSENKRRHVTNPAVLDRLGAKWSHIVTVSDDDINIQEEGDPIE